MATEDAPAKTRKLHLLDQEAHALLAPLPGDLARWVGRLDRYIDNLTLAEADHAALRDAREAVARAHGEIDRIWREREGAKG